MNLRKLSAVSAATLLLTCVALTASGSITVTNVTTTATGPCTGTATLGSGFTTTYTDQCTNTFIYPSTSTSTSTSAQPNVEMVDHAFATGCATLSGTASAFIRWDQTPIPVGADSWQVDFLASDSVNDLTLLSTVTTINGQHNFTETMFKGNVVISNYVQPISSNVAFPGNFGQNEFTDFYQSGNSLQFFWYGPNTTSIMASFTLELPVSMNATDVAAFFAPLVYGQPLQFQPFTESYFFVGQDDAGPNVMGAVNSSPCATALSLKLSDRILLTNACEVKFSLDGTDINPIMTTVG